MHPLTGHGESPVRLIDTLHVNLEERNGGNDPDWKMPKLNREGRTANAGSEMKHTLRECRFCAPTLYQCLATGIEATSLGSTRPVVYSHTLAEVMCGARAKCHHQARVFFILPV